MADGMLMLRLALQLALAALIAVAGAALTLIPLAMIVGIAEAVLSGRAGDAIAAIPAMAGMALFLGGLLLGPAVLAAGLPAWLAGGALWLLGRRRAWARRRLAWGGAGALIALIAWLIAFPPGTQAPSVPTRAGLLSMLLVAGMAGGQMFRAAMAATAPFFGFEDDED